MISDQDLYMRSNRFKLLYNVRRLIFKRDIAFALYALRRVNSPASVKFLFRSRPTWRM